MEQAELDQIREAIREEVSNQFDKKFKQELEPFKGEMREMVREEFKPFKGEVREMVKEELKPLKSDVAKTRSDVSTMLNYFDHEVLDLRTRVNRIEGALNITPPPRTKSS